MHDLPILVNITMALITAFAGGILARRIGLPSIVGYLLAGIAIGPFTPGFIGDSNTIEQLAELGVIFLMLGVGLRFSFEDLWKVRDLAIPGALILSVILTISGFLLSQTWGWSIPSSVVLGLAISVSSTVVLVRGLIDHSLLNTPHGQAAVGWTVMEDILTVFILVVMPVFAESESLSWTAIAIILLKLGVFGLIMFFLGKRFIPWLLEKIAHTRSRELFILAILAITLGTALGSAWLFGISLALGAFVAGAIISQSHLSHQVGADIIPFRDSFAVLFFVSIGMLVNPEFLWNNPGQTALLFLLIVAGRFLITIILGTLMPHPALTFLVVAVGLSQIGEFSFILGQEAVNLNLLSRDQYSLILAGALLSITFNPAMYHFMPYAERLFRSIPILWKKLDRQKIKPDVLDEGIEGHVIIVGYGRVGSHMVDVLDHLKIPQLVIDLDAERIRDLNIRKIPSLYGDAANSEVITFARLNKARIMVITLPDEAATAMVVTAARDINPNLRIITRAGSVEGVKYMQKLGAHHVVHPELEGGLEIVRHTLLELDYPLQEVYNYTETVRRDSYNTEINQAAEYYSLQDLIETSGTIGINWVTITGDSPVAGMSLLNANIRARTGASVIALVRDNQLIANPKSMTVFQSGDQIGLIGEHEQIETAVCLFAPSMIDSEIRCTIDHNNKPSQETKSIDFFEFD